MPNDTAGEGVTCGLCLTGETAPAAGRMDDGEYDCDGAGLVAKLVVAWRVGESGGCVVRAKWMSVLPWVADRDGEVPFVKGRWGGATE